MKAQQEKKAEPLILLLGHQYTPENFSQDNLKLDDRPKAALLLRAAQKANNYAKMCLVTSYVSGSPATDYYDDDVDKNADYNPIANWVINRNDREFFLKLDKELCQIYFVKIDAGHWLELVEFLGEDVTKNIFNRLTQDITYPVAARLLSVLRKLHKKEKYKVLVASQIDKLPHYLSELLENSKEKEFTPSASVLQDMFWIESSVPQSEEWCKRITEILTATKRS